MTEDELEEAWAARRCLGLPSEEADRLFFTKGGASEGKRLCLPCPAREPCAVRALEADRDGDYMPMGLVGGLTAAERKRILEGARP